MFISTATPGEPLKMATVNVERKLPPMQQLEKVSLNLTALLPYLSVRRI